MENGKMCIYGTKFGPISLENDKAVFFFPIVFNEDGTYYSENKEINNYGELLSKLWIRIKGN